MIYPLLVLFNSILFFLVPFFAPNGDPTITTNFPSSLVIDQESVLEIKIGKSQLTGFASFQMDLPDGFIPREIENAGAECTINEGQLVWTWNELPEEEELVISIGITPGTSAYGKKLIGGSFYYIENNEKKSKDMGQTELAILKEGETELAIAPSPNQNTTTVPESYTEPAGVVEVNRVILEGNGINEKKVEITIKKGMTKGFARYSDNLEAGFTAKALKTDGSSFSIADGKIKFVWVSVPEKEELKVSYLLLRESGAEELVIVGEYSYLEHNQSKKAVSTESKLNFTKSQSLTPEKEVEPKATVLKTETNANSTKVEVPALPEKQAKQQQNPTYFSIQVGAFTNPKITAGKLKRKFKLSQKLRSEFQEGYSKFMFGSFAEYKTARLQREQAVNANGVKSAFVVAYNDGKRITVQEALMTLNQKWFK